MKPGSLDSLLDKHNLPTEDQLIFDDGIPMEIERHRYQIELLISTLKIHFAGRNMFVGGNMFVYFSPNQVKTHDFRGPDFFIALDVPIKERKGWVVWEEGKSPDVVIEIISDTSEKIDKEVKPEIYQNILRVPEYYWYHPFTGELAGFRLNRGIYQEIAADKQNRLKSNELDLLLTRWQGSYDQIDALWLRWMTTDGYILPTKEELKERETRRAEYAESRAEHAESRAEHAESRAEHAESRAEHAESRAEQERIKAEQERIKAEQERIKAEQERIKADKMAKKLRDLGIDIDDTSS